MMVSHIILCIVHWDADRIPSLDRPHDLRNNVRVIQTNMNTEGFVECKANDNAKRDIAKLLTAANATNKVK